MTERDLSGRTLGEFVLRERIGEGGYGVVYLCEQPALRRQVVVKVLRRHDPVARERFLREARLASRLEHPYAAHVYAFGAEADGVLWLAMELVPGITLKDWLEKHGPMPLEQFVPFFECVAEVVQAAHDRGIVHRDLKPSNMMVIEHGERLIPKLLDFGIAKVDDVALLGWPVGSVGDREQSGWQSHGGDTPIVSGQATLPPGEPTRTASEPLMAPQGAVYTERSIGPRAPISPEQWLTRTGLGIGSRAYMSPEQWRDAASVGPASDIYSLGVVAYQVLTGRVPFGAEQVREQFEQHEQAEVPSLAPGFSAEVDAVIRRALAKRPGDRQQSALELAAALRTALRAQPREQLRSLAQVWDAQARPATLLLKGGDLLRAKAETTGELGDLERAFVGASQRHARRRTYLRRLGLVAVLSVAAVAYRTYLNSQFEHRLAEQGITQGEVEQGRQALLHGDSAEAQTHLWQAYQRGARTPDVEFMLARALQPRMAEKARFHAMYGRMWSAIFSPDGSRIVTTDDHGAQVWDARTYKLQFALKHADIVYQAIYTHDGSRIITASRDGSVRVWNSLTGVCVRELRYESRGGRQWQYYKIALPPDDRMVAAMEYNGTVTHVWDMNTGVAIAELHNQGREVWMLAFSADGRWLASGFGDVGVFDTESWKRVIGVTGVRARALGFDPSGPRLVIGTFGGDASIWEVPSGVCVHHLRETGEPIEVVAFSPNGDLVATASRDGVEQVWNAKADRLENQFNFNIGKVDFVEFDSSSQLLLSAGHDGTVVVADVRAGTAIAVLDGARGAVWVAHFDPSSRLVVGASWDGIARLWDSASPYQRWRAPPVSDGCGVVASLEPEHRFIAVACRELPMRIWDTARDQLIAEIPAMTSANDDWGSTFPTVSSAGDYAAIASGDLVKIYSLPGGRLTRTVRHESPVSAVAFGPSGHDLVSGSVDGLVLVTRDDHEPEEMLRSSGSIDSVALLEDGRVIASDAQRRLRIYAPSRHVLLADLEAPGRAMLLRPSRNGRHLVTIPHYTSADTPALWSLESYRMIGQLDAHVGLVRSARFVRDGEEVLTAGADGAVRLWSATTGRLLQTFHGGRRFLADATLDPSRTMVVAAGGDGRLWFWDAASGRALWTWPAHKPHVISVHFEGDNIITRGFGGDVARWTLPKPQEVISACRAELELDERGSRNHSR